MRKTGPIGTTRNGPISRKSQTSKKKKNTHPKTMIWPMASTFYATKFSVRGKQEVRNAENGSREGPESKCHI